MTTGVSINKLFQLYEFSVLFEKINSTTGNENEA